MENQVKSFIDSHQDKPFMKGDDWCNEKFGIQNWIERVPQRILKDTVYGHHPENHYPRMEVLEDALLNQVIKMDISSFLIAEKHAMLNTAKLMTLAPDEKTQIFLSTQVLDESRHFEVFSRRLTDLGVSIESRDKLMKRYTTPQLQKFFDLIDEHIDKKNFIGGVIGQNLILEGMAYPVYRYEMKYWSIFDPGLSEIIKGAFADEVYHTSFGESYLRSCIEKDVVLKGQLNKMIGEFHQLMTEVFEAVIRRYISLYQSAINPYMDLVGGIEIFPGKKMHNTSEEEQVRILLSEIQKEFRYRAEKIGLD